MFKVKQRRNVEIVTSYVNGDCLTYERLGKKYNITRERIRQILSRHLEPYQLTEIKKVNSRKRIAINIKKNLVGECKKCGVGIFKDRIFCGRDCSFDYKKVTPEHRKRLHSLSMKRYYAKNKKIINVKNRIYYYKNTAKKSEANNLKVEEYTKILNNLIAEKRQREK